LGATRTTAGREWYRDLISVADNLYDEHLAELRQQGETT
jgi:hypothetical protein